MSGYREHSFDPNSGFGEAQGRPMLPFNWVQWTGVAIGTFGLVLVALDLLGRIGWILRWVDSPTATIVLPLIGVTLINSRRQPSYDPAPELASARRKWLLIIVALCAAIIGAAVAIEFSGA